MTMSELEFLSQRLDEIRMSEHDRLRARAQLARAEAIADLLVGAARTTGRLVSRLIVRPIRRVATSIG